MPVTALSLVQDFALTVFVALWVVVGAGDLSHQKIRHRLMLWGTLAVFAAYVALAGISIAGQQGWLKEFLLPAYYRVAASHTILCVVAALALWRLGVWPAGDAKLFALIGALYPLLDLGGALRYERVFLSALINTFIPAAAVLFLRACYYIYDTRFKHSLGFLRQLGWKREAKFLTVESWARLREGLREVWPATRALLLKLKADPRAALSSMGNWIFSMLGMALLSYYLKDFFTSPLKLTLLWTALFTLYRRVAEMLGSYSRLLFVLPVVFVLFVRPPSDWSVFTRILGSLTLFSFCMFLGMNWAMKAISGGGGLPFFIPFLLPFLGMAIGYGWSWVMTGARTVLRVASNGIRNSGSLPHVAFGVPVGAKPALARAASEGVNILAQGAAAGGSPLGRTLLIVCGMGLFFGLSLVLVRLWDQEVRPIRSAKTLEPFLVLAPQFVERLHEDPDFEAELGTLYPDGLTRDQAERLRGWCAERSIEDVPLTPTMSFAAWIFLGFFVSHLLAGGHVLEAVF